MLPDIFSIKTFEEFEEAAQAVFRMQYNHNPVYRAFCDLLNKNPADILTVKDIPFLPVSFFKTHTVIHENQSAQQVFTSSGTTGMRTASHHVADISVYEKSFLKGFEYFYGSPKDYIIIALLPSYLERQGSSLIYMMDRLIHETAHSESGFYLNEYDLVAEKLQRLDGGEKKILLVGVTFALLDLVESHRFSLKNTIVMETGGMKGRRKELIREELHEILKKGFGVKTIHSEYGMTELLSQAYSKDDGIFACPPWMQVHTRDVRDAMTLTPGQSGGINVIDLANYNSCSFLATQDLGKTYLDGTFEVLGRFDNSDVRGCNLLLL